MSRHRWLVAFALLSCRSTPTAAPAPAAAVPSPGDAPMRVTISEPFRPMRGDSAIRAFVPVVAAVDSGGECRLTRTAGSAATMMTAYFPSYDSSRNNVTLWFDSAGHLTRYSDSRGRMRLRPPPGSTQAERDSVLRALVYAERSTSISLDWAVDQALASNRGGGKPTEAIMASVREMENVERLGPPTKRIAHVRRLCGV
jgi:hypothetical protein